MIDETLVTLQENHDAAHEALVMAAFNLSELSGTDLDKSEVERADRALQTAARQFAAVDLMLLAAVNDAAKRD